MYRAALVALGVIASTLSAQSQQAVPRVGAFEVPFDQVKWISATKDSSVQLATLRVDSASGATQVIWRFRPGLKGPCEWHAANQSVVVIQGSIVVTRSGSKGTTLGVGGFAFVPQNVRFRLTIGSEPTMVLSTLDGHLDNHRVNDVECGP
jgi:quercetin dioxygenase-like cupin family protein